MRYEDFKREKIWVEPVYKLEDRIGTRAFWCLTIGLSLLFWLFKRARFGISEYLIMDALLGVAFFLFAYLVAGTLKKVIGKEKVMVKEGYFYDGDFILPEVPAFVPPPGFVPSPTYPPYPSKTDPYRPPSDKIYGSAHWEDPRTVEQQFPDRSGESRGFLINATTWVGEHMHGFCMAGSGQGKGVAIILPNLLSTPTCSWFVLDPKGESAQITARWQKEAGQTVHILDPWNEQQRYGATHGIKPSGCNPLSFIKGNPGEIPESCAAVAMMIAPDEAQAKDPYWNGRARTLIKTYLLHLISSRPDNEQHLGTIYKWLRYSEDKRISLWADMRLNLAFNGLVEDGINQFYDMDTDKGPLPSIISNAHEHTEFMESESLRASLSSNDFNPYDLNNGKTTVYLCLPERYLKSHAKWLRLIVCVCLKSCNFRPNKRVNFILDELAILGKMPDVQDAYAFSRGQKVCVYSFIQSLSQLYDIYGQYAAEAMLSCARLRQFFGVFDLASQKYLSEYLGDTTSTTISRSYGRTVGRSSSLSYSTNVASSISSQGFSTDISSNITNSTGSSESSSTSTNYSRSETVTHTPVGRRLLTAEEIGREYQIITFIDGRKYLLPRIPFWSNYYNALAANGIKFLPNSWEEWKYYHHALWGDVSNDDDNELDVVGRKFRPRADGRVIAIGNGIN